jgi:hypothetical protein
MSEEITTSIMKLMPIWILILVFGSALVQAQYPTVNVIDILDKPWVQGLLISMGLGGIPLSMFKRVVKGAKEFNLTDEQIGKLTKSKVE